MTVPPIPLSESTKEPPPFAITVRDIAKGIIPRDTISIMTMDGGPAGFGMGQSAGFERGLAIEQLLNLQPTFKVGIVADATGSMHNDAKDVRGNVAPWLVSTLVNTAVSTLNTAKSALQEGLRGQLNIAESDQLMKQGIQLMVTIAATGDSRLTNDEPHSQGDKSPKTSLIDDPPIDMLVSKTTVKLTDSPEELEQKAQHMLRTITEYSPSKYGGNNDGESIPEAIAAIAGIIGPGDQLLPEIGKMIAHYERYGEREKIKQLVQYLRALGTFTQDTVSQRHLADLLVTITDEGPPKDTVVTMQSVIAALRGRKTPLYLITPSSLMTEWKSAAPYPDAKFLDLEKMSKDGQTHLHPMLPAIELGMNDSVVNSLRLLTG